MMAQVEEYAAGEESARPYLEMALKPAEASPKTNAPSC